MWKSKFYGAFVLILRVNLHAIDATPARWRGDAGSSPLDRARSAASSPRNDLVKNCRVHPAHWLISTQLPALRVRGLEQHAAPDREARRRGDLRRDAVAGPAHRGSISPAVRRSWQDRCGRCLALRACTKAHLDVPVPGGGQPFGRQFCVRRRRTKSTFRCQRLVTAALSAAFLRAEGGGQHPSLVRSALPCREPTVAAFTSFIRGCT